MIAAKRTTLYKTRVKFKKNSSNVQSFALTKSPLTVRLGILSKNYGNVDEEDTKRSFTWENIVNDN